MSEAADDEGTLTPPRKKPARHTASKWQPEWTVLRMKPSGKGSSYAYCSVCFCDFSVAGGGVHEVKRHCASRKHTENLKALSQQPALTAAMFASKPILANPTGKSRKIAIPPGIPEKL